MQANKPTGNCIIDGTYPDNWLNSPDTIAKRKHGANPALTLLLLKVVKPAQDALTEFKQDKDAIAERAWLNKPC
jgi:hypothetical protein